MTEALTFPTWPQAFTERTSFRCATCDGVWQAPPNIEIARPICTGSRYGQRHGMTHMTRLDADEAEVTESTGGLDVSA